MQSRSDPCCAFLCFDHHLASALVRPVDDQQHATSCDMIDMGTSRSTVSTNRSGGKHIKQGDCKLSAITARQRLRSQTDAAPLGEEAAAEGAVAPPWSQSESIPQLAAFVNPFEPTTTILILPQAMNAQGLSLVSALTVPRRVGTVRPNKCQAPFSQRCAQHDIGYPHNRSIGFFLLRRHLSLTLETPMIMR